MSPKRDRDVPRIDLVTEGTNVGGLERQLRDHGDAVIALLPVQRDVFIAEPFETLERKGVIDAFGFLQAQYIRPHRFEKLRDDIDAQAHRIDIPGRQGKAHGDRQNRKACADDARLYPVIKNDFSKAESAHG